MSLEECQVAVERREASARGVEEKARKGDCSPLERRRTFARFFSSTQDIRLNYAMLASLPS